MHPGSSNHRGDNHLEYHRDQYKKLACKEKDVSWLTCVGTYGDKLIIRKSTHTGVEDAVVELVVKLELVVEDELVVLELEVDEDEVEVAVEVEVVVEDELVVLVDLVEDEVEVAELVEDDEELEHVPYPDWQLSGAQYALELPLN
jgi:hypothetical protein